MLIHGYDFAFSSLNADDIDRLEAANEKFQKESRAELKRSERDHLSYADSLRCQCRAVMRFLDEVFGSGASATLGLDGSDYGKAVSVLKEVQAAVAAEKQALQDTVATPQNREQRREKKLKKHRTPSAVSFPSQMPAEKMVTRVDDRMDKATRRKQLLQELADLEND